MLSNILIGLLAVDCVLLVTAILLQAGKGGGLAATFGGASSSADSIMGTRQAGNLLTKLTWWTGGIFIGLAFLLSMSSAGRSAPSSVLDQAFTPPPSPVSVPSGDASSGAASVLPVQPAPAPTGTEGKAPPTKTP